MENNNNNNLNNAEHNINDNSPEENNFKKITNSNTTDYPKNIPSIPYNKKKLNFNNSSNHFLPSNKSNKKLILISIFLIVLLFLIGGGTGAYYYAHAPEKIIQKTTQNYLSTTSGEYMGKISLELKKDIYALPSNSQDFSFFKFKSNQKNILATNYNSPQKNNFSLQFSGAYKNKNDQNIAKKIKINIDNIIEETPLELNLEIRGFPQATFFYVNIPAILGMQNYLSFFNNQWIKVTEKDLNDLIKELSLLDSTGNNKNESLKIIKEENFNLSKRKEQEIGKLIQNSTLFQVSKKLPSEKINNIKVYHYQLTLNKKNWINFLNEASKIIEEHPLSDKKIEELNKDFNSLVDWKEEVWITKKDLLPYKIKVSFGIKEAGDKAVPPVAKINFEIEFKNFNKDNLIKIDKPQSYIGIKEVVEKFQKEMLKQMNINKEEASSALDSDNDQLPDNIEKLYGTDPHNPDTDGDGYSDGHEVQNGYNPNGPGKLNETNNFK